VGGLAAIGPEQVQLELDRVGSLQALEERREGARLRRLEHDPEQVRCQLELAEHQLVHRVAEVLGHGFEPRSQPLLAEVERVVVVAVADGADAHQDLRRLGNVDLDLDRRRGGEIEDRRALVPFDGHLTDVAYSPVKRLTRHRSFDKFRMDQESRTTGAPHALLLRFPPPARDRPAARAADVRRSRQKRPAERCPQVSRAIPPSRSGPARRGGRCTGLVSGTTPDAVRRVRGLNAS
jgi:hypothetical protein